ncbi:hypothetical protein NA57DRAFT_60818 [Rhizodiscina lignyota]|uniref:Uncharacterized protein n=1 Tax=Rhizodiscina lignyota TaxID=1504668 RepID=A0A9P4M218_9PEZI|nr:hypothetical protein NA57DRAFT_60818 [Rhizodiscina lignyota]
MATRNLSPGANLLRSSRLFSIPPPLPEPAPGITNSPTATLRYPTRQAIVTPASSQHRGDWGGKRPLPTSYTSKVSNPTIRINRLDTDAQVTDFDLASDHVRTLQKWQEMRIPMFQAKYRVSISGSLGRREGKSQSAFDKSIDITDPEGVKTMQQQQNKASTRWKYDGDSVADMTPGDFSIFLEKKIKRPELRQLFMQWLRQKVVAQEVTNAKAMHDDKEGHGTFDAAAWLESVDLDQIFSDRLKMMRGQGFDAMSNLNRYLEEFLDLPPRSTASSYAPGQRPHLSADPALTPSTHPSAGLSYLRNKMYVENHPVLGPRAEPEPVRARIMSATPFVVSVGGVVVQWRRDHPPRSFDFDVKGGPKKYVVPRSASVAPDGRIELDALEPRPDVRSAEVIEEDRKWKEKHVPDYFKRQYGVEVEAE